MSLVNGYNGVESTVSEGERSGVRRQRSLKLSLYPGRLRSASRTGHTAPLSPISANSPTKSPVSLSPRGESMPMHQRPLTSHYPSNDGARPQTSLHRKPSEASRLRALDNGNGNGFRAHSSDGRRSKEMPVLENFSRPGQPSIKRKKESPAPLLNNAATSPIHHQPVSNEQTIYDPASPRDRGFSSSSIHSAATAPSYPLRPSTSIPDYQAADSIYSRQRNLSNYGYISSRGMSRPDSNYSTHRRDPVPRANGFDGEEVRASFRSALTTNSSFLGTSGTERSSVMTKSSSATSIFGRDEGMSVDDAIGMYEVGFNDSGVEDNDRSRPATAGSEMTRRKELEEAMNEALAPPPVLGGPMIRDSVSIFRHGRETPVTREGEIEVNGHLNMPEKYSDKPPPSRPTTRATVERFDETRDRYGFRKKTQHLSVAQYETWNGPYTEYLARRRKKWVALMKDSGFSSNNPKQFPPKSVKVKRFVRKGIPPDWRGAAWYYYAGGPTMVAKHPGLYEELVQKAAAGGVSETDDEIIERDLHRTFPDNIKYKPDPLPLEPGEEQHPDWVEPETPILHSLRRVLQAFSIYNPKIGYCQSLNFLAGLLLLFMDEEKSFWVLNIITGVYLPGTHELNLEGANVDLGVLMTSIKDMMPSVWAKIGGELDGSSLPPSHLRLPPITLCTTAWFMSCFIGTLPIESTLRVWDSFFFEGSKTLFRIALTVFKLGEQEIKAVTDPMEIFQVVQTIPRRLIDCNVLMEACFKRRNGFGHLSQETIEKGRAERRRGYAEERERAAAGVVGPPPSLGRRGTVRKGGTLFGRKGKGN